LVVVSLHWGGNWGFDVASDERQFAHALIGTAGADLIHGHSSHHVKGLEVVAGKLVIHGCGDFINDYEGIRGYESFRGDLAVMYFPELDSEGKLLQLAMVPMRRRRLRLERAGTGDAEWLCRTMTLAGRELDTRVAVRPDGCLLLDWS
jgi:poly-gamma-glutamate synthesis protein (capsule biosynthesis protein)